MGGIDEKALIAFRKESLKAAEEVYAKLEAQGADVRELQELGVALELALAERIEGLYGEGMTRVPRKITEVYFKAIMLDAWTRTSQVAAYITGKNYIINIGKQLSTGKFDKIGSKIVPKKNAIARLEEEARRLGLKPDELVTWYNNGADINDPFFRNVKRGAVRFQGEIIMNPATTASQKPLVYGGKGTKLLLQLGSFPVAFSNTALKNLARQWIRYPIQNGAPVMGTAATLFMFGDLINMIKSGGTHKDLPPEERARKNIERVGLGTQAGEMFLRGEQSYEYNDNLFFSFVKGIGGPFTAEVMDAMQYGTGGREIGLTNMPGWHTYKKLDPETAERLLAMARELDKERGVIFKGKEEREQRALGGVISEDHPVKAVSNNPADRKLDNLPISFNEVAANKENPYPTYKDEMERLGFQSGNIVEEAIINIVDELKNSKYFAKESPEEQERLLKAYEGKTVVNTSFLDPNRNPIKTSPNTYKLLLQAQELLENREDANKISSNRKSTRGGDWKNINEWITPRNPNNYNVPIMIGSAYISPDEKAKKREVYLQQMEEYEQGLRAKKPPKQAGLKSFHITGDAIDLNQHYYDALGERADGKGGLIGGGRTEDFKAARDALLEVGFKQHPNEWWHFSHGEFDH